MAQCNQKLSRPPANPSGVGGTGFFLAASSGVIFGSADSGFSCAEFGLANAIPRLASRIELRTRSILRMVPPAGWAGRKNQFGLSLSGFYARSKQNERHQKYSGDPLSRRQSLLQVAPVGARADFD